MHTLLIINPKAGRKAAQYNFNKVVKVFSQYGMDVTVVSTKCRKDATNITKSLASQYDLVVCMGGDGTLNEVVIGLMSLPVDERPKFGYIPAGTTNDFAKNLKIPTDANKAAEIIANGKVRSIDIGYFQNTNFIYSATFGFLTEVAYLTDQKKKNVLGKFAYFIEGIKRIWRNNSYEITMEYDGHRIEGNFAFGAITNTLSLAGLIKFDPKKINLDDGLFEVILIENPKKTSILRMTFAKLMQNKIDKNLVHLITASNIKITSKNPIAWCIDGESGGDFTDVMIENKMRSIEVISP